MLHEISKDWLTNIKPVVLFLKISTCGVYQWQKPYIINGLVLYIDKSLCD